MARVVAFAWVLLFLVTTDSLAAGKHNMIPEVFLGNSYWSFAEPIPASPSDLINVVAAWYAEINETFDKKELTSRSPFFRLDVTYTYGVQRPGGQWDDIPMVVRIDGSGKRLTYADILWQLHKAAHEYLKDQDHKYLEGLYLLPQPLESGVPAYEAFLGS